MNAGTIAPHFNGGLNIALRIYNWSIGEIRAFAVFVDGVNAESIDALVEPEANSALVNGFSRGFIVPVEIRLLFCVEVKIVLFSSLIPGPCTVSGLVFIRRGSGWTIRTCAPCEISSVVAWGQPVASRIETRRSPDVPVSFLIVLAASALLEPSMLVAGVIHNEIQNQFHPALVTSMDQLLDIFHGAIGGQHFFIVRDVIAHVMHG